MLAKRAGTDNLNSNACFSASFRLFCATKSACLSCRAVLHGEARVVSLVLLCRWCDAGVGGGGRGPGGLSGAGVLPGASSVAVGAVLLLLLSLVSGCSLML